MIARLLAILAFIALSIAPAAAQESVSVATERLSANGALLLAVTEGYFKAEGLTVVMRAYPAARTVVEAVGAGTADFGLAEITAAALNLAGRGAIKAIAAQAREKRDYEGNEVVASNAAYDKGLRKFENLAGKSVGLSSLGTSFHYQLGQIARAKGFDLGGVTPKSVVILII
jgi:NitT/TauT family transport system substrate-binding protein